MKKHQARVVAPEPQKADATNGGTTLVGIFIATCRSQEGPGLATFYALALRLCSCVRILKCTLLDGLSYTGLVVMAFQNNSGLTDESRECSPPQYA